MNGETSPENKQTAHYNTPVPQCHQTNKQQNKLTVLEDIYHQ